MAQRLLEVRANAGGRGWFVAIAPDGTVLSRTRTKPEAVSFAKVHLGQSLEGGTLRVYLADGRTQSERVVPPSVPNSATDASRVSGQTGWQSSAQRISSEGKVVDRGLESIDVLALACALAGAPFAALMNPNLQEAARNGWIALTLATFTWTVGVALGVIVGSRSGATGWPLVGAVSLCFLLAFAVSGFIGHEVLTLRPVTGYGGFNMIASFGQAAVAAYGPIGFALSTALGVWLGVRAAPHVEKGFLV